MFSGGKVTLRPAVTETPVKAAEARFKEISGIKNNAPVEVSKDGGFEVNDGKARFVSKYGSSGGMAGIGRFGKNAPVTSTIKGDTPRVLSMMEALLGEATPLKGELLKRVIENVAQ